MTFLRLIEPEPAAPPADADEATRLMRDAWTQAQHAHVRLLSMTSSAGLLRLHNGGSLPTEPRASRKIDMYTLSGMARELREIADLAAETAAVLQDAKDRVSRLQ